MQFLVKIEMNPSELDESSDQTEGTHDKMIEGIYEFDWKTKWLKGIKNHDKTMLFSIIFL